MQFWEAWLVCPIDRSPFISDSDQLPECPVCGFRAIHTEVDGRLISDMRAADHPQRIEVTFQLPVAPLDRYEIMRQYFRAVNAEFPHYSRREVRKRFGTKIDKSIQFYSQQLLEQYGPEAAILDLGCGSGGNRLYLQSLGFKRVLTVDWYARGADLLVDAHRLPLASSSFQMVLATAVFEHLYNPYLAMAEVGRVLKDGGYFLGGASFWEAWHGSSYFHFTPDGWNALLQHGKLTLEDLWPGWGILPATLSHVLMPGRLRELGYGMQRLMEGLYRIVLGDMGVRKLQLRASGSYQVFARKSSRANGLA